MYITNLHNCFSELQINDQPVTKSGSYYNYKTYVQTLVSYNDLAKSTNLYLSGWLTDDPLTDSDGLGSIEPSDLNESQMQRNAWFRKNIFAPKKKTDYSEDGFTFLSPLKVVIH